MSTGADDLDRDITEPELDYAFLADWAEVRDGKLDVLGASYTSLDVSILPWTHDLYIAGRLRVPDDVDVVPLDVTVVAPDQRYRLTLGTELERDDSFEPYRGRVGFLFAVQLPLPIALEGLYGVRLVLGGELVRVLAFDVRLQADAGVTEDAD